MLNGRNWSFKAFFKKPLASKCQVQSGVDLRFGGQAPYLWGQTSKSGANLDLEI